MVAVHMDTPVASRPHFRIGRVLSRSLQLVVRNFIWIGAVLGVTIFIIQSIDYALTSYFPDNQQAEPTPIQIVTALGTVFGFLIVYVVGVAIVMQGVFQYLREGRTRIGDAISRGFARAPVLIAMTLVIFVVMMLLIAVVGGISAGITFSIWPLRDFAANGLPSEPMDQLRMAAVGAVASLPVLFLLVIWNVGGAACMAENLGPIRSLGRSRKLTKGFRWRMTALVIITMIVWQLPQTTALIPTDQVGRWPIIVLAFVITVAVNAVVAVIPCVTFMELRQAKEGKDIQQLANVFD